MESIEKTVTAVAEPIAQATEQIINALNERIKESTVVITVRQPVGLDTKKALLVVAGSAIGGVMLGWGLKGLWDLGKEKAEEKKVATA